MAAKVMVRHIPYNTTREDLLGLFESQGEVVSIDLPVDHVTGQLKGHAIVEMSSAAEAEDAVHHLNHHELGDRRLSVRLAERHELAESAPSVPLAPEEAPAPGEEPPKDRPERPSMR